MPNYLDWTLEKLYNENSNKERRNFQDKEYFSTLVFLSQATKTNNLVDLNC